MKQKRLLLILAAGMAFLAAGCMPILWNVPERSYLNGDLRWYATDADALNRNIAGRMALIKSAAGLAGGGAYDTSYVDYDGIVVNRNKYQSYNFIISGPERRSFFVEPLGQRKTRLIPGVYTATVYDEHNRQTGPPWIFTVNTTKHDFLGVEYHWYVFQR